VGGSLAAGISDGIKPRQISVAGDDGRHACTKVNYRATVAGWDIWCFKRFKRFKRFERAT